MDFDYKNQDLAFWQKHLTEDVLQVCRLQGTERAGTGRFDKFYEPGTYYCACCGGDHPLYDSTAKFDSGTGWPSFYEALPQGVVEKIETAGPMSRFFSSPRTEVSCARCGSHLGHVFEDGPQPTGKRYCMNSVALSFTPEGDTPKRTFSVKAK